MSRPPEPAGPAKGTPDAREPLSRERVLRAALAIVDREGVENLSMRRLGAELGVEAMSLYNYVPNKAAVLDGVVELVLSEIELPDDITDWKELFRESSRSSRSVGLRHPNAVALVATRPFNTIASLRPVEFAFEVFKKAGFDPETSLYAFRTIAAFTTGYSLAESGAFFGEVRGEGQLTPDALSPEEFPRLMEVAPHMATADHDKEFEFALDVIIAGLESKLPD
ncbi:MAG: TetR/AcrR family transcriptional regulator C-terminal domain-containing protein [Actinomycetota bacterium]